MGTTGAKSENIKDGEVKRVDLNVSEVGSAVIRKVIAGEGIEITSSGADPGTGDVTISSLWRRFTGFITPRNILDRLSILTDDNNGASIQIGHRFAAQQTTDDKSIEIFSGMAVNQGISSLGLYEASSTAFPNKYGFLTSYNAATNLYEVSSVVDSVVTQNFRIERGTGLATFSGNVTAPDPILATHLTTRLYEDLRRDSVKVRNTATGNLNTGVATFNNFTTADELGSTLNQFAFATNGITPNFNGVCEVIFNVELIGNATRAVPGFRWSHNSTVGPWVRHSYIRNASGHTESSVNFTTQIPVAAGQAIQIQHDNFAGGGTVTSPANGVEFIIKRVR